MNAKREVIVLDVLLRRIQALWSRDLGTTERARLAALEARFSDLMERVYPPFPARG